MRRFYALIAVLAALLAGLTAYYRAEPDTFQGIADTKEIVVNSPSPVEIRRILVVQGQAVSEGDTLLELHNPELDLRISQISHELSELKARKAAHATLTKSELRQLKAEQEVRVSEIRAEIAELEAQYEMNRSLVSELHSLDREKAGTGAADGPPGADADNPILSKLRSLRNLLELAQDPMRVHENRLSDALSSDGDPLAERVARLEDELRILTEDRKRLLITAGISGMIGSVDFKPGEKVSPFTPILTLHAASPSFVRGYIHEDVHSQVGLGQRVEVRGSQGHVVEGEVVGIGSRIVEYPERLRKRADILIWGREIIVSLPAENRFLLGEKVLIVLTGKKDIPGSRKGPEAPPVGQAPKPPAAPAESARTPSVAAAGFVPALGNREDTGVDARVPGLEISGLVHLADLDAYLAISDDTPRKRPELYLLDSAFDRVGTLLVAGLDKIDDMEAISSGIDGSLYLLSSQSRAKSGKLPGPRKLLVKTRRDGKSLTLAGKIALLDVLESAARGDSGSAWARFLLGGLADQSVDIEGMALEGDGILLGFKAPLLDGKAVILRVAGVDALLSGRALRPGDIALWKVLDLKPEGSGRAAGISDLLFAGEDLYILSPGPDAADLAGNSGRLWKLARGASAPVLLQEFRGAKPEGLVRARGRMHVAFDNGADHPSTIREIKPVP